MMRFMAYSFSCLLVLAGLSAPVWSDEAGQERPLTLQERLMVEDALNAYSLQIDPEYYLSGDFIEDAQTKTPESRKRRLQQRKLLMETRRRHEMHRQAQIAYRVERERINEERRRKQIERQARLNAKRIENQIYRCNLYRTNERRRQSLALQNPKYVYRRTPAPPGC